MNDYNRGNSGFGSTVGADIRAQQEYNRGQQERQRRLDQERQQREYQQRLQRESQERQHRQLNENQQPGQGSVQGEYAGTYSAADDAVESDGSGYTVFCVLAFIGAAIYGITFIETVLPAEALKTLKQFIGPDGVISGEVFFWSYVATVAVIGILIRKILRWLIGLGLLSGIAWGIYLLVTN